MHVYNTLHNNSIINSHGDPFQNLISKPIFVEPACGQLDLVTVGQRSNLHWQIQDQTIEFTCSHRLSCEICWD